MQHVFFNEIGKLRSGWRAAIFLFVFISASALFNLLLAPYSPTSQIEDYWGRIHFFTLSNAFTLAGALILGGIAAKRFEGLPFKSLGANCEGSWHKHFALGSLLGAFTLTFAVLIAVTFGGERFDLNSASGGDKVVVSLVISLGVFAIAAAAEEALFRGYIFQTFTRSGLAWLAIMLTSVFFGVVHLDNPNASVISTANTVLAGVWFGLAYLRTRDLWFVWGMHLMWNWTQGSVFGIEVSGLTEITPNPLLREIDTGPIWLTGSTYGIEGGVACTLAILLSMAAIYFLPIRSNHIET